MFLKKYLALPWVSLIAYTTSISTFSLPSVALSAPVHVPLMCFSHGLFLFPQTVKREVMDRPSFPPPI